MDAKFSQDEKTVTVQGSSAKENLRDYYKFNRDVAGVEFSEDFEDLFLEICDGSSLVKSHDQKMVSTFVQVATDVATLFRLHDLKSIDVTTYEGKIKGKKLLHMASLLTKQQLAGKIGEFDLRRERNYFGLFKIANGDLVAAFVRFDDRKKVWVYDLERVKSVKKSRIPPGYWFIG